MRRCESKFELRTLLFSNLDFRFSFCAASKALRAVRVRSAENGKSKIEEFCWRKIGGEGEIRTLERVLAVTRFRVVRLQPLGHLSARKNREGINSLFNAP